MIRTLVLLAVISFGLAIACFAVAFAIVGGPFYIDDDGRFHRTDINEISVVHRLPAPVIQHIS
jgi:hypothetical protein